MTPKGSRALATGGAFRRSSVGRVLDPTFDRTGKCRVEAPTYGYLGGSTSSCINYTT